MPERDQAYRSRVVEILSHVRAHQRVTQRDLANQLGIALGLTNLLVRGLVKRGWIEMVGPRPTGVRYVLTSAGLAAQAREMRRYLSRRVRFYAQTRELIRHRLQRLSADWPAVKNPDHAEPPAKRIVFYGAGEVAEIGYVSLQGTDLRLVGVTADNGPAQFFGMPVHPPSCLAGDHLNGEPFDYLIVMSLADGDKVRQRLERSGFPRQRIVCL